jgi:hypothetical protein
MFKVKHIGVCDVEIVKWPLVKNFSPFVCGRALVTPPPVLDVNLRLILVKVHICLSVPFDQYWQRTRGAKASYALKKNRLGLWATGFSCRVADSRSRAGTKSTFDYFLIRQLTKFRDSSQPALYRM